MSDWLASEAAAIIRIATLLFVAFGAASTGIKVAELAARRWGARIATIAGWSAGLLALFALFRIFGPAIDTLQRFECRGARDFQLCMEPPDPEY